MTDGDAAGALPRSILKRLCCSSETNPHAAANSVIGVPLTDEGDIFSYRIGKAEAAFPEVVSVVFGFAKQREAESSHRHDSKLSGSR